MRCDARLVGLVVDVEQFQSLSGFLMRCDNVGKVSFAELSQVSIPIGFSDAL